MATWTVRDVKRHETRSTFRGLYPDVGTSRASCAITSSTVEIISAVKNKMMDFVVYLESPLEVSPWALPQGRKISRHRELSAQLVLAVPIPTPKAPKYRSSRQYNSCSYGLEAPPASILEPSHTGNNIHKNQRSLDHRPRGRTLGVVEWHC